MAICVVKLDITLSKLAASSGCCAIHAKNAIKGRFAGLERSTATKSKARSKATKVILLSGGNPQIAKGEGDAPVQAYIAAMPGWKRDLGKRLVETVFVDVHVAYVLMLARWGRCGQ
jgi:hypothetical protein